MALFLYQHPSKPGRSYYPASVAAAEINAVVVVSQVAEERGFDTIRTAGMEGEHMGASLHYVGAAWDFDFTHRPQGGGVSDGEGQEIAGVVSKRLGALYDVQWEPGARSHLHVEYQPKHGPNMGR